LVLEQQLELDDACEDALPAGAERTCVVTREKRAPEDLIRFVLGPDQTIFPDLKRKLPGRGVWVGLSKALVAQAVKKQLFSRGLREKALASPDLPDLVERLLVRDALQSLSMANKAGLVTTGFAKVEAAIGEGEVSALVHARDGKNDGKRKLGQALRRQFGPRARPEIGAFLTEELDAALGRGNVVHAALGIGPAAKVFLASTRRVALYRGEDEAEPAAAGIDLTKDEALEQDFRADVANGQENGEENGQAPGTQ
jgi:predicted RNA-binding protein YlxR (DUF448 family)